MTRRTYESDGFLIERPEDLENIVKDKREIWRSNPPKLREDKEDIKKDSLMNFLNMKSKITKL